MYERAYCGIHEIFLVAFASCWMRLVAPIQDRRSASARDTTPKILMPSIHLHMLKTLVSVTDARMPGPRREC